MPGIGRAAALLALSLACAQDPANWHAYQSAGEAAAERGRYDRATKHLEAAEREAAKLGPAEIATTRIARGRMRRELGDAEGAEKLYDEAETLFSEPGARLGRGSHAATELALERGWLALGVGDVGAAEAQFLLAIREAQRADGPGSSAEGWAQLGLGQSLRLQGRRPEAGGALHRALAVHRGETSRDSLRPSQTTGVMAALTALAALDREEGRLDSARTRAIEALRTGSTELGAGHPRMASALVELALVELARGDREAAAAAAQRAVAIASARLPETHVERGEAARVLEQVESAPGELKQP
jgi:tetratricopeptide (TPR) repeat protein